MAILLISCLIHLLSVVSCHSDSESAESNRIEAPPVYDTIIYSDIADIISEFENNGISPFDIFASESQSSEKVEDLLTEYQRYLEKAHKQRNNYLEKTKLKNKVPLTRHEQFSKVKPASEYKHGEFYYPTGIFNTGYKFPQSPFNNPFDVFIPLNSKGKYINKPEITTTVPKSNRGDLLPFEKIIFNDKKIMTLPPTMRKSPFDAIKPPCVCKNENVPCDCNCKNCLIHVEPYSRGQPMKLHLSDEQKKTAFWHPTSYENSIRKNDQVIMNDNIQDPENTLNIRIKIDLQLPKLLENNFAKYYKNRYHDKLFEPEDIISKELTTALKLPFPFFNFPVPMDVLGFKKGSKNNKDDMHKITIHKKKKSRTNNNNKKHRKKIITFHNIKLEQQPLFPIHFDDNYTESQNNNKSITAIEPLPFDINNITNKTEDVMLNDTQTEENVYLSINASNNIHNITDYSHKIANSIETDNSKVISNVTTKVPTIRKKRDVPKLTNETHDKLLKKYTYTGRTNSSKEKGNGKKSDKNLATDTELLYWPSASRNESYVHKKNITTIILENEHKKTKLNMSTETIRQNHTIALEQAIFGDVDWDDMDTVAPAFMSFVGKYVRGILTFCSQQVCHSMNCANETCLHRVCIPADRLNNKGHCGGSNSTDSVASMESIMDLPSNIAFEVVDILQNKMLGKIFGKATFCITTKCITLAASKKSFVKTRCTIKELNTAGHCLNAKTVKIM